MSAKPPRTVVGGLRGLRNVVCLSALLMAVGELPAVARVVRVDAQLGEIEIDGSPSAAEIEGAIASASRWLDELHRDQLLDDCCDHRRALDEITVEPAIG